MSDNINELMAAADAYEDLHVPALFQQWATPMLDAAEVSPGDHVLDVACGTGILARNAVIRVGSEGKVSGIDAAPGMVAVAERLEPAVDWRQGLAEELPYADGSFDAVVSQFGLMFFADRSEGVAEMLRVLKPGGRLAVAVWEDLERSEAYPEEVALLERMAGKKAADALRAPFVLGNPEDLLGIFAQAGAPSPQLDTRVGTARFPSLRSMVEADLRGWLPIMGVELEEELIQDILQESERALSRYVTEEGRAEFKAPAHIVSVQKSS